MTLTTIDEQIEALRNETVDGVTFDNAWYHQRYANIIHDDRGEKDGLTHYVAIGAAMGLRPCPLFDTAWYLREYPRARRAGINPLLHFLRYGKTQHLKPHRLFDTAWYLATYPSARASALDPLSHFILEGSPLCRPHALFDPQFYIDRRPDIIVSKQNPLSHFLELGWEEGLCPNAFFDVDWYLERYVDARRSQLDPLSHFIEVGASRDYRPNQIFDTAWYRSTYLGSEGRDINPLVHFIERGATRKTQPNPCFNFETYAVTTEQEGEPRSVLQRSYLSDERNLCALTREGVSERGEQDRGLRLLFVDAKYPRPDSDSGSVDTYNHLKILRSLDYEITFLATAEFFGSGDLRAVISELGVICVDIYKFSSVEDFLTACGKTYDVIVLSRVYSGGHYYELARNVAPRAIFIFNPVDLHHVRENREAEVRRETREPHAAGWTRSRELYLVRQCDLTIVVSTAESKLLASAAPSANIMLLPLLRDIPGRTVEFAKRRDIGFIGGFGHRPNLDAVEFFLDAIWPLLLLAAPDLQFEVVGSDMPDHLRQRKDRNVMFSGHVGDLGSVLSRWRLTVAPLRYGAGAKGKIVSSLAHGVPCVATHIAFEGMELREDQALMADKPDDFVSAVLNLYNNEDAWRRASDLGLQAVTDRNDIRRGPSLWMDVLARARIANADSSSTIATPQT